MSGNTGEKNARAIAGAANPARRDLRAMLLMTRRGLKIFLKDRASVFFSLLAPLIILLLYVLFLGDVQILSLIHISWASCMPAARCATSPWPFASLSTP